MNSLETHVLELIGENVDSPDVFTDTDEGLEPIRESLNDAIEEITHLIGSYKRTYQIFLQEGQSFYRIKLGSGDLGWITDVWDVNQKRRLKQTDLIPITVDNPRWLTHSGSPYNYMQIGTDVICVTPAPSGGTDILELSIVVIPKRMETSTDRIFLRETFRFAAVYYAVGEFYASRGDAKEADSWMKKYLEELGMDKLHPKYNERMLHFGNKLNTPNTPLP